MRPRPRIRWQFAVLLALAATALLAAPAAAHPITFHNQTGYTIEELYFDWAQSDEWTIDRLGDQVLYPGEALSLPHGGHCWWDIRLLLEGASAYMDFSESVDFCEVTEISFYCNDKRCWLEYG